MSEMSELISGKEARLAWANGQDVEFRILDSVNHKDWKNIYDASYGFNIHDFDSDEIDFRLKPQTVKITIEVPKPFEPKDGEKYFHLAITKSGYLSKVFGDIGHDDNLCTANGAWRTKEEIEKVISEIRKLKG